MKKKIYEEDLVSEVTKDFLKRQKERKPFEAKWKLNYNFFMGNQFSGINRNCDLENFEKQYSWQEQEVFNHISPIVESRLSKLSTVRPKISILSSDNSDDLNNNSLTKNILNSAYQNLNLNKVIMEATTISEITGTSFYKVVWNSNKGKPIAIDEQGNDLKEGEVEVEALSPYEIFPDNQTISNLDNCESIIHAKALSLNQIKNTWGVDVESENVNIFNFNPVTNLGGLGYKASTFEASYINKQNYAVVIERYEKPCADFLQGRLTIVCGGKLLYLGPLPFINQSQNKRGFPFVKQVCIETPGCFWGTSVIERLIPIQRAYNAVKNRKHEYLNRLSMGILTVEDGSVDVESLQEEGLSPGKILIYRQGSNPPKMMDKDSMPTEFSEEEEKLLSEFSSIGGISNILTSTNWSRSLSGTALELLVEQDSARINITAENIRESVKQIAAQILKLYKQFAVTPRQIYITNSNNQTETVSWNNSNILSGEVILENND